MSESWVSPEPTEGGKDRFLDSVEYPPDYTGNKVGDVIEGPPRQVVVADRYATKAWLERRYERNGRGETDV